MMTLKEYKEAVRKYRGHLPNDDDTLQDIYSNSCYEFLDFTLSTKSRGVRWMAWFASTATIAQQQDFVTWFNTNGLKKKEHIDIWVMENL